MIAAWLGTILTSAAVFAMFAGLVATSRKPARWAVEGESALFEHGAFVRYWLLWSFFYLPTAGLVVLGVYLYTDATEEPWVFPLTAAIAVFMAGASYVMREEAAQRVMVDSAAVSQPHRSGDRRIPWGEVREVRFSMLWNALVVIGRDGTRIRASVFLRGFDLFTELLHHHLGARVVGQAVAKAQRFRGNFGGGQRTERRG